MIGIKLGTYIYKTFNVIKYINKCTPTKQLVANGMKPTFIFNPNRMKREI